MALSERMASLSRTIQIAHGKVKEDKGVTATSTQWSDKQPHPINMGNYNDWNNDPEVDIALDLLTDIIAGVGFHTEMPEDVEPKHPNKKKIDEYCDKIRLDEKLKQIERIKLSKGFCPVEILGDYDLKILPPEGFYIWKTKKGQIYRYTQEVSGSEVTRWELNVDNWESFTKNLTEQYTSELKSLKEGRNPKSDSLDKIILFINEEDTSHPYGQALTDSIGDLIDIGKQMNEDIGKALHRYAWPKRIHEYDQSIEQIKEAFTEADLDEDLFLGNVSKDSYRVNTLEVNPATKFQDSIAMIYYQKAEALHAPLLLYLKNATEASATVMMESVDRFVNGSQRYNKRRIEHDLFEPQCGKPVPRVIWGQPKTGLEKVTLTELASIINSPRVAKNQAQEILKQFFPNLPEPEWEPILMPMQQPFQKQKPEVPVEQMLEKLNDLQTGLTIIETNYVERKITLIDAMRLADKTITVYTKRAYPEGWEEKRNEEYDRFSRKLLGIMRTPKVWTVQTE